MRKRLLNPTIRFPKPITRGFSYERKALVLLIIAIFAQNNNNMKRTLLIIGYWTLSIILVSGILCSMEYSFSEALFVSTTFFPVAIIFKFCLSKIDFTNRCEGTKNLVFLSLFVFTLSFLLIHVANIVIQYQRNDYYLRNFNIPDVLLNPIFICFILLFLLAGDYIIGQFIGKHITKDIPQSITFTSDRQSTTLLINEIMYIESNDTEVWIHATEGRKYRNKTSITSWENLLGHGFIRTHRSFLANRSYCTAAEKDSILIGDERIPISRKYKDSVIHTLQN